MKVYDGYDVSELGYPQLHDHLLPLLKPGQWVLDLGIGTGHLASPLAYAGLIIVGVDHGKLMLDECRRLFVRAGLGKQLIPVHADALVFLRATFKKFDVVVLSDFLMFLKKTKGKEILRRSYTLLKSGGYIWVATMSTNDSFYSRLSRSGAIDEDSFIAHSHCAGSTVACFYRPNEIENFFGSLGGQIVFSTENINDNGGVFNLVLARKPV